MVHPLEKNVFSGLIVATVESNSAALWASPSQGFFFLWDAFPLKEHVGERVQLLNYVNTVNRELCSIN